jgi:glyoxylase-like metal-dependent hydrolase (beta-lactamase superfamily II)
MLTVKTIENGPFQANCYLLVNADQEALVIDPGAEPEKICRIIRELGLKIAGYPLTHGHMDHVGALGEVWTEFPAPVGLHALDAPWAFSAQNSMPPYYEPVQSPPPIDSSYSESEPAVFGPFEFSILETPGHSPGGVCFLFPEDNILISGDTLFAGSIGRTDLPGSQPQDMTRSLQKLLQIEQNYTVYPGHGPATTLEAEKSTNPFLLQAAQG